MTARPLAALVLVAALLAGCLGSETTTTPTDTDVAAASASDAGARDAAAANLTAAEAPLWAVGDSWMAKTLGPDGERALHVVVVGATSGSYTLATDDQQLAVYDALFDVSFLGPTRAADLAGSQAGTPVKFFAFPLEDGKTWTTTWDGAETTVTAKARGNGAFDITAASEAGPIATYDYVPALRWWSRIEFPGGWGLAVEARHENWTGTYVVGTAEQLLALDARSPAGTFTVTEGATVVALATAASSAAEVRGRLLVDPTGQPHLAPGGRDVIVSPGPSGEFGVEMLPPTAGDWRIALPAVQDPEGTFQAFVSQVTIEQVALG